MENNFQFRRHEKNVNDVIEKTLKEKDWRKSKKYSNIEVFEIEENEVRNQTNREHKKLRSQECCRVECARFIRTVCMRRIRWSCEGLTSVHNEYTGYTLKHLLLRHMYNLPLPKLCATLLVDPLSLTDAVILTSHCTVRCLIYWLV